MTGRGPRLQLGLIAPPALPEDAVAELGAELAEVLAERYPDVDWDVSVVHDALAQPPVPFSEIVDAARRRLLNEDWDLAAVVTDVPLRLNRRPLITHASPTHGVALVSLPAHGVLRVPRRLVGSIADAVGALVGDDPSPHHSGRDRRRRRRARRRLVDLATDEDEGDGLHGIAFVAQVIGGNLRLLLGMLKANRPWRLIVRLSRAVVGAHAVAAAALIASDAWRISGYVDPVRLALLTLFTLGGAVCALILVHGLWERSPDPAVREQVTLFNLTTLTTLALGVGFLYLEVFVVTSAGAALIVAPDLLADELGHPVGIGDYLRLAWLTSSLATVGGALGSALESDSAVREAAYLR